MSNYVDTRYDFSGANLQNVEGVNTGLIIPWSSTSIPSGFLECDGSAVSRSTYSALFAVIGTTYGSGDGSTTFNLPDLNEKLAIKKGASNSLGQTAGSANSSSAGNLSITVENTTLPVNLIGPHTHPQAAAPAGGKSGPTPRSGGGGSTGATGGGGAHSHNSSVNFSGSSFSTLQETLTLLYLIKT
jgi:microcystin-dependent protein